MPSRYIAKRAHGYARTGLDFVEVNFQFQTPNSQLPTSGGNELRFATASTGAFGIYSRPQPAGCGPCSFGSWRFGCRELMVHRGSSRIFRFQSGPATSPSVKFDTSWPRCGFTAPTTGCSKSRFRPLDCFSVRCLSFFARLCPDIRIGTANHMPNGLAHHSAERDGGSRVKAWLPGGSFSLRWRAR